MPSRETFEGILSPKGSLSTGKSSKNSLRSSQQFPLVRSVSSKMSTTAESPRDLLGTAMNEAISGLNSAFPSCFRAIFEPERPNP